MPSPTMSLPMPRGTPKQIVVDTDFAKNSLKAMCIRKAGKIINTHHMHSLVTSQGVLPYSVARHFLHKISSGQRLATIEQNSPHILGDDEEIWQKLIKAKFGQEAEKKQYIPEDEEGVDWYGVWLRYEENKELELEAAKEALRQSYGAAMNQRADNTSHKVEAKYMPKPPKDPKLLANAGIPLSRRNYDGSHKRSAPVGFIGQAATGIKRQRNLVELARKEAAAQVAMRKQAKRFMPDSTAQIRNAPKSLVQAHETDDRQKRLAPPPMPDADKQKPMDPVEARIARVKAAEAERKAKAKGGQMKKEEEESKDVADLFDEEMLAPSERKTDTGPQKVQLPGGGMARKLPVKRSPTLNPTAPRPPPKKVDIFFTGKKKPVRMVSPPNKPTPGNTSTAAIPKLDLNGPKNKFTPAKLPPRMTSMAQGDRGALRPTGTIKERKAVEMKSMRPVTSVADRQGAGRPSAPAPTPAQQPRPTTNQRPNSATSSRSSAVPQQRSGADVVASMLAGLVAKQDAERCSNQAPQGRRQPPQSENGNPSLKRAAPIEAAAPPAQRRSPEPAMSRSNHTSQPERSTQSVNRPRATESPAPSRNSASINTRPAHPQSGERKSSSLKRASPEESPAPAAKRIHTGSTSSRPSPSESACPSNNTPPSSQSRPTPSDYPTPQQQKRSPPRQKGDPFGLPKPKPKRRTEVQYSASQEFQVPTSSQGSMPDEARQVMAAETGRENKPYERKRMNRVDGTYVPPHLRGRR